MKMAKEYALKGFVVCLTLSILCGLVYPLAVTGIAQLAFREQAGGSIIEIDGKKYGSVLLAQDFSPESDTEGKYLWGRAMSLNTSTFFDGAGNPLLYAGPSNKSPAGVELERMVAARTALIRQAHPDRAGVPVPVDLVTNSGSGLDPHISPAAADYQAGRIAAARGMTEEQVRAVIARFTTGRALGLFGEPVVNVLQVNLALDGVLA